MHSGRLTELPESLQHRIVHCQPRIGRLGLVRDDKQDWTDAQCQARDEDDRRKGADGGCDFWVFGQKVS